MSAPGRSFGKSTLISAPGALIWGGGALSENHGSGEKKFLATFFARWTDRSGDIPPAENFFILNHPQGSNLAHLW